jgi:hypothetical protein
MKGGCERGRERTPSAGIKAQRRQVRACGAPPRRSRAPHLPRGPAAALPRAPPAHKAGRDHAQSAVRARAPPPPGHPLLPALPPTPTHNPPLSCSPHGTPRAARASIAPSPASAPPTPPATALKVAPRRAHQRSRWPRGGPMSYRGRSLRRRAARRRAAGRVFWPKRNLDGAVALLGDVLQRLDRCGGGTRRVQ